MRGLMGRGFYLEGSGKRGIKRRSVIVVLRDKERKTVTTDARRCRGMSIV